MIEYLDFISPISFEDRKDIDTISFGYHINNFDFPTFHGHKDYWEFTILTDGALENRLNDKSYYCSKNTLFYATTKDTHALFKKGEAKPRYINILVKENKIEELLKAISPSLEEKLLKGPHCLPVSNELVLQIDSLVHRANLEFGYKRGTNDLIGAAVLLILQHLFLETIDAEESKPTFELAVYKLSLDASFLSYTVKDLCGKLNYSRVQLNRLFKKHFGKTPHDYLIQRKLGYAKNLLEISNMSTSEIASKVGFSNLSQFNIDFKKEYGVTPGAYRKKPTPNS